MKHKNIKFQFYFIRHGESESNIESGMAYANDHNAPLTKRGHEQSLALGKRLKNSEITFDKIYSSTLTRAIETTTNMLKGMELNYQNFEKFFYSYFCSILANKNNKVILIYSIKTFK